MSRHTPHDNATSNVLAWTSTAANVESALEEDAGADADEPPDMRPINYKMSPDFRRKIAVSRPKDNHASLLTRALQSASEGETTGIAHAQNMYRRRRSITSDISVASTADLTSDTGLSTPARTNSPSPRLRSIGFVPLSTDKDSGAPTAKDSAVQTLEKKRCISFACTARPKEDAAKAPGPAAAAPAQAPTQATQLVQPRKPCIKFACTAKPSRVAPESPPQSEGLGVSKNAEESGSVSTVVSASSTIRKARSPATRRTRPLTPRRALPSPAPVRKKKYLTASSDELQGEVCHFHEFASDHPQQEDWIREEASVRKSKLTLDDVLKKENDIRRLGKEAEEEAEEEEEDAEAEDPSEGLDDDDDVDGDDEDQEYDDDDEQSGYGSDDDFSDGYNTDEDLAFADSDEEDEDDGLLLWTLTTTRSAEGNLTDATPIMRPTSVGALSDSSDYSRRVIRHKRSRQRSIPRAMTPELPDSTDFVCGTMDEDRPLEEAYMTRLAARKQEKLRVIPQDIDPSFPTSDPEDDDDVGSHHSRDSGEPLWLHGELEDLDEERPDRRRRKSPSPKGLRSPPPAKRYHSPPPKARGRSPRRVLDRSSPKRVKSPAPVQRAKSPAPSPTQANKVLGFKNMAAPTGVTHTKSLPRAAYFPAHLKHGKRCRGNASTKDNGHKRGAIDIVKGLEQKRQRRKEKFHQKYCDRARKGQIPEKRAKAGEGAERMRELAGKMGQGNYVISI
ncbi:hypothetical protein BD289DRAFT_364185 [Coniella lustricola]|uniref:Uncharacterized protein n=1 Tax=Coniella lustricola TaxID=2025994 RepID=A0A2T3AE71_9PEZI|nr:hypothetical protein BD289DRAFT_364185 [Coniella lustricola]